MDARVLLAVTVPPALLSFGQIVVGDDLLFVMSAIDLSASRVSGLNVFGDRPGKGRQFSSDRGGDHCR